MVFTMNDLIISPQYCQYASGVCDQSFNWEVDNLVFFLYPSEPEIIAQQVEAANAKLKRQQDKIKSISWREMDVPGQLIFCEICKTIRKSTLIVADITTLNFNLLFEIGFCIGLGQPVLPIRDANYEVDKKDFDDLGLFDTLGYFKYSNSQEIVNEIVSSYPRKSLPKLSNKIYTETPLYFVKGPVDTDGAVQFMTTLKKSALSFRTYDPIETPRLSLYEARKQVNGSIGVFAHLISPFRKNSRAYNALSAFICGMAMAQQKVVFMLQEEFVKQPIDYRDIVVQYNDALSINQLLQRPIYAVVKNMQTSKVIKERDPELLLEQIDLGDTAAENEIRGLQQYFVRTGQFNQAKQGHARLVVGRKGSGKTATFYEVRNSIGFSKYKLVIDLKPEGHQFIKLKEYVLSKMSEGLKEHTLVAFWNYILLTEIAHKILETEKSFAERDAKRFEKFNRIKDLVGDIITSYQSDFSQRLLIKVDNILESVNSISNIDLKTNVTQLIYEGDINKLNEIICDYLSEKSEVWLLFDNIDKGWPTRGASQEDILIVRGLLNATRKLQRQLEFKNVSVKCLLFIRTDIYELLMENTRDKGKDSVIQLDWDDEELFRQIVLKRIESSTNLQGNFREIWQQVFESHIATQDTFTYILDRTLMRPRDLLSFLQKAIQIATNRGNKIVTQSDILQAEKSYSEDIFLLTSYEIEDTYPKYKFVLYSFQGCNHELTIEKVKELLMTTGIEENEVDKVIELLLWFGFLGINIFNKDEEKYSYSVQYNLRHLLYPINTGDANFVIHPAFRSALEIK